MDENKKVEIARQLASSFGMEGKPPTKTSGYDRNTGTLFVGSTVYHYEDFDRARRFFKENKKKMHSLGDGAAELYEIGEAAMMAFMEPGNAEGGRIVVKNKR